MYAPPCAKSKSLFGWGYEVLMAKIAHQCKACFDGLMCKFHILSKMKNIEHYVLYGSAL